MNKEEYRIIKEKLDWLKEDTIRYFHDKFAKFDALEDRLGIRTEYYGVRINPFAEDSKANFNPSQPRVPAGNPDGGQWTDSGGNGYRSGSDRRTTGDYLRAKPQKPKEPATSKYPKPTVGQVIKVPDNAGRIPSRVNIFIGGAWDDNNRNVWDSHALNKRVAGNNYYFSHDAADRINNLVHKLPKDTEINLIGHSWGGDTAAKIAIGNPGEINLLITIDPVSYGRPDFEEVANSVVGEWVNVNATGTSESREESEESNLIAGVGRSWDKTPEDYTDVFINAPVNHRSFDRMMSYVY